jgi:hypothetical protein
MFPKAKQLLPVNILPDIRVVTLQGLNERKSGGHWRRSWAPNQNYFFIPCVRVVRAARGYELLVRLVVDQ